MQNGRAVLPLAVAMLMMGCGGANETGGGEMNTGGAALPPDFSNPAPRVVLETNKGRIVMELDREAAPLTVDNFLFHVENRFYDGLMFHRVRPGFMIQAGAYTPELAQRQSPRPTLQNEANNGLKNVRGTVAMARLPEPHSAKTQFFINLVNNPALDFTSEESGWGYAVFGRVIEGLDIVDAIAQVPTQQSAISEAQPLGDVIIERASVEGG